jgi:hypothetical protein
MQIPLQPLTLLLPGLEDASAGSLQFLDAGSKLRLQTSVLEGDPRCSSNGIEQLRLFDQLAVVDQRRDVAAVTVDDGRGTRGILRHGQRPPLQVDVGLEVRQSVRERQ